MSFQNFPSFHVFEGYFAFLKAHFCPFYQDCISLFLIFAIFQFFQQNPPAVPCFKSCNQSNNQLRYHLTHHLDSLSFSSSKFATNLLANYLHFNSSIFVPYFCPILRRLAYPIFALNLLFIFIKPKQCNANTQCI